MKVKIISAKSVAILERLINKFLAEEKISPEHRHDQGRQRVLVFDMVFHT